MGKKIYLSIMVLVTAVCVVVGTVVHIKKGAAEKKEHVKTVYTEENQSSGTDGQTEKQAAADGTESGGKTAKPSGENPNTVLKTPSKDQLVSEIHVDSDVLDLTIFPGPEYDVSYEGIEDLKPEVTLENGILTISQKKKEPLNFFKLFSPSGKAMMTVQLPDDALGQLTADMDTGDLDISDLSVGNGVIRMDVGDIDLDRVILGTFSLENDTGNIEMEDCTSTNLTIDTDVGNVELEGCAFKDLKIASDVGDVVIDSREDLSRYVMLLSRDVGRITINGEDMSKKHQQTVVGEASGSLTVETDTGDLEITYPS